MVLAGSCLGNEGLDSKFVETAAQFHGKHAHFSPMGAKGFTIKHYAGDVHYKVSAPRRGGCT
jgi:myosin heavy subunit